MAMIISPLKCLFVITQIAFLALMVQTIYIHYEALVVWNVQWDIIVKVLGNIDLKDVILELITTKRGKHIVFHVH